MAFAIDISYLKEEIQVRSETFKYEAFLDGYTRTDFSVYPTSMPRSNIYTFDIGETKLPVVLQNKVKADDRSILVDSPIHTDIKIYLYSGPPHLKADLNHPAMSHMDAFNAMLSYDTHPVLDLVPNSDSMASCTPLTKIPLPAGFYLDDLKHLAELNDNQDMCMNPSLGMNPAECGQGGGC